MARIASLPPWTTMPLCGSWWPISSARALTPACPQPFVRRCRRWQRSKGGVSLPKLASALAIDKSAASRRAKDAESKGYLVNFEDQKAKPTRLVVGDPLPEDADLLPAPDNLECCSVADGKGV